MPSYVVTLKAGAGWPSQPVIVRSRALPNFGWARIVSTSTRVISPVAASRVMNLGMRGSDSMMRSITSASPGTWKRNCSEISASVGGLPAAFWCWAM